MDLQSKPNEVWCRRDTMMNSSAIEKQTIHSICTNELIPRVKFINRGYDVEFSENWKSICQFVLSRCNLSSDTNQREFWVRNRKYVINTITTLRSNKSASLRWHFLVSLGSVLFCWGIILILGFCLLCSSFRLVVRNSKKILYSKVQE